MCSAYKWTHLIKTKYRAIVVISHLFATIPTGIIIFMLIIITIPTTIIIFIFIIINRSKMFLVPHDNKLRECYHMFRTENMCCYRVLLWMGPLVCGTHQTQISEESDLVNLFFYWMRLVSLRSRPATAKASVTCALCCTHVKRTWYRTFYRIIKSGKKINIERAACFPEDLIKFFAVKARYSWRACALD